MLTPARAWTRFSHLIFLILGLSFALLATADDLIVGRALLVDPTGTLSISEVAKSPFEETGTSLAAGYSQSVHWIRLQVRKPATANEIILRIRPTFLDEVRLYEASDGPPKSWITRVTGDRYPYAERDRAAIALGFIVKPVAAESTYYLRMKTTSSSQLTVEALEPMEALQKDHRLDMVCAVFLALMLWVLAWASHDYAAERKPLLGLFVLHQTVYVLFGIAVMGYLAPLVPASFPGLADMATSTLVCGMTYTFLLLSRNLLQRYAPPPLLNFGLNLLLLVFPLEFLAIISGHAAWAHLANALLVIAIQWYYVLVTFHLRQDQAPSRRFLQVVYTILALLVSFIALPYFGLLPIFNAELKMTALLIPHGLISSGLMVVVLYVYSRDARRHAQQSLQDLDLAQRMLELERTLKEKAEIQARTDFLTGMFNRRHFIELAEHELARAIRYQRPLSLVMIDIDHFKSINDTRGHSAGDAVLQKIAQRIRDTLRDVDIVGRMGGEEFAVLLTETAQAEAFDAAERLRLAIVNAPIGLPEGQPVRVSISLGISELKGREINLDNLLDEADRALYQAKESGRNRVILGEPIVNA